MRKLPILAISAIMMLGLSACTGDSGEESNKSGNSYSQITPGEDPDSSDSEDTLPPSGDEPELIEGTQEEEPPVEDIVPFPGVDPETGEAPTYIDYVVPAWPGKSVPEVRSEIDAIEGYDGKTFVIDNKTDRIYPDDKDYRSFTVCRTLPEPDTSVELTDDSRFLVWIAKKC